MSASVFSLEINPAGVGFITIDLPGEAQNVLKAAFVDEIESILEKIQKDTTIKAIVIISGKPDTFIAGADITMLNAAKTAEEAEQLSKMGQNVFAKLEQLNIPVVAAIHGACLGGGLELAMACHSRVCSNHPKTMLGLPEVQLGLLPGGGGTQRLPQLVGIQTALDMMLTGKQLRAKQAKKVGLVDEVVELNVLRTAAENRALKLVKRVEKKEEPLWKQLTSIKGLQKLILEEIPQGRKILFDQALKKTLAKTHGNYPAPEMILKCVEVGVNEGVEAGYRTEAQLFGDLVVSSQAQQLMNIFFATTELKKDSGLEAKTEPKTIQKIGVLGGGLMGAGIAYVSVDKAGVPVRLRDVNVKGVANALQYSWKIWNKKFKKRFMSQAELGKKQSMLTGTTDYSGFSQVDLVIEAVFEDIVLKKEMVSDVESHCKPDTIFATNTSSIPLTKIIEGAERPDQIVGMHYFSPVDKMPLLEIIVTEKTADWVVATAVAFGKSQGKTVIVVNDGAGFYVNRILAPYMNEAAQLIAEGVGIDVLDSAIVKAGFPVGPIALLDEVGIDVATKVSPILQEAFGDRMKPPALFDKLKSDNRLGRKNKRGFYQYSDSGSKSNKEVDDSVYTTLGVTPTNRLTEDAIAERCMLLMVNEAVRCLDDGIIRSARDGDIGAIFGIGFPPFVGGPFRYIDMFGSAKIVERLQHYQTLHGDRFEPAPLLLTMAEDNSVFYS
jgi:3-hydroxyacyl-CoA dehydrogenase / enoyl-CoA hydratase / 3-hydroxybutyryl-CoA epimerase